MKFTNSEGREYEEVASIEDVPNLEGGVILRPIPQKPKWKVKQVATGEIIIDTGLYFPDQANQAQLIKECIEMVVEYIFKPYPKQGSDTNMFILPKLDKARNAMENKQ